MQNLLVFFIHERYLFVGVIFFLGLLSGSFLNVVIYRIPKMLEQQWQQESIAFIKSKIESKKPSAAGVLRKCIDLLSVEVTRFNLLLPHSHCPKCKQEIRPWQNIPVISFLLLQGKCSNCKTIISLRYPVVEIFTGLMFGAMAWKFGVCLLLPFSLFFVAMLIVLTFIDADTNLLPDNLTLLLLWVGLIFNLFVSRVSLQDAVVGAVFGYLLLWVVFWLFKLITGKDGMGYGDFKFLSALGAWLGWQQLPLVILISSVIGALCGLTIMAVFHKGKNVQLPFGPYLAVAGLVAFLWGNDIVAWYLHAT